MELLLVMSRVSLWARVRIASRVVSLYDGLATADELEMGIVAAGSSEECRWVVVISSCSCDRSSGYFVVCRRQEAELWEVNEPRAAQARFLSSGLDLLCTRRIAAFTSPLQFVFALLLVNLLDAPARCIAHQRPRSLPASPFRPRFGRANPHENTVS